MIRNGDVELKGREEEIRFLKMEVRLLTLLMITFHSIFLCNLQLIMTPAKEKNTTIDDVFTSLHLYYQYQGPVFQSLISANPGLTLNKTYRDNPGLVLIEL